MKHMTKEIYATAGFKECVSSDTNPGDDDKLDSWISVPTVNAKESVGLSKMNSQREYIFTVSWTDVGNHLDTQAKAKV